MDYQSALDYVWGLVNFETKPPEERLPYTLDRMRMLLNALGNPQDQVPAVHITGSKGKGSTAAMIESVLRAAGYHTGLYTSPHLHTPRERVRVAGALLPHDNFITLVERIRPIAENLGDVTTFEFLTAMGFCYFVEQEVDIAVVEVGLGGTLDATNLICRPLVSIITPISLDHTSVLGDTVEQIAHDKAGIIKEGVPVVSAQQEPAAREVLRTVARDHNASILESSTQWQWERTALTLEGQTFTAVSAAGDTLEDLFIPLLGRHQLHNASTALTGLVVLRDAGIEWDEAALRDGFSTVSWPARIEIVQRTPLVIADGAHNGASAQVLRDTLEELIDAGLVSWDHFCLVLGISSNKNVREIITPLVRYVDSCIATQAQHPRACPSQELATLLWDILGAPAPFPILPEEAVDTALNSAQISAGSDGLILVTGSLFVAAEARAAFGYGLPL